MPTGNGMVLGCQRLSAKAARPQGVPEVAPVTAVQEVQVGLADGDVCWRGIGVQLLVPLLQEGVFNALH